jgi:hypothetical protein
MFLHILYEIVFWLTLLIVICGWARVVMILLYPRKLTPEDFESPDDWGDQPSRRD